jgi:hypothetical protein
MKLPKFGDTWEEFNLFQKLFGRNGAGFFVLMFILIIILTTI